VHPKPLTEKEHQVEIQIGHAHAVARLAPPQQLDQLRQKDTFQFGIQVSGPQLAETNAHRFSPYGEIPSAASPMV
jgi:hypothetical protein